MKVKMIADIRGTRDGEDWPAAGSIAELPDAEAADLIMNGYAVDPADAEDETADAPSGDVETATSKRRGLTKASTA